MEYMSPTEITRAVTPFIGRRLHAAWRAPDTTFDTGDVWLEFCLRGDEARLLRLTADRCRVLPGYVSGGGPTAWALRVDVETSLPAEGLQVWNPFRPHEPANDEPLHNWALTELWVSPVACNVQAPGGYWLQDVCGGLALHFSNSAADYGRMLGTRYEHHDMDAPHEYFVGDDLPPLVGAGLWRRMTYLRDITPRDDAAVRHCDDDDYRGPAVRGCLMQFFRELYAFQDWLEKEPGFRAFRSKATRQWYKCHVDLLSDLSELLNYSDTPRGRYHREALSQEVVKYGLGTLFTDAWYKRDTAAADEPRAKINATDLKEIRRRYAPMREAYRQWFLLQRQACLTYQRLHNPKPEESVPGWIVQLDAALTHGSLRFDEMQSCLTSHVLRDDFRDSWAPHEDPKELHAYILNSTKASPQDVLIEGDEERVGTLRITWWPVLDRRDRVIALRIDSEALQQWWRYRRVQPTPSKFEQHLAWKAGRAPVAETWPTLADIVVRAEERQLIPPRVNIKDEKLPPYTRDDIRRVASLRMQGEPIEHWPQARTNDLDLVWTFDSDHLRIPLLIGRDVHPLMLVDSIHRATERVIFPAIWPPEVLGEGFKPFYLMWSASHWREERIEGRGYRRENWLLPVQRWVPLTEDADGPHGWRWGLIDLDGRFVLPCRYPAMGRPQTRCVGKPVLPEQRPPLGRREPWCWVWVGEKEHTEGLLSTDREPATGNVIEAWSGERMNAADLAVRRLDNQFMVVCARGDIPKIARQEPVAQGLCNLATGHCGPVRWKYITTFGLSISHGAPAQCFETGGWSYIDENGELLLDQQFASAGQIDSHLAIVRLRLEDAKAANRVIVLADGSERGGVGVFGPHGVASLGHWFVEPQWREILGEYDGHFVVQNTEGRWGMVTPEGEAVTPFVAREVRDALNGDILQQVTEQFKRVQRRRFMGWMQKTHASGSLAVMAGKLRSSFGAYDYGALPLREISVRLTRDLPAAQAPYDKTPLTAGAELVWRPGQRNYYNTIDLRTHTMIGPPSEHRGGYDGIAVPWDALALAFPPMDDGTEFEQRCLQKLKAEEHLAALNALLDVLEEFAAALDADASIIASDAETACKELRIFCTTLAEMLVMHEPRQRRDIVFGPLRNGILDDIDFPGVSMRERNENMEEPPPVEISPDDPPWIRDKCLKIALKIRRSWPAALCTTLDQAVAAYQTWLPLFSAALAEYDNQGNPHA